MNEPDNKGTLKIWIAALAFSVLLLATTFALMATYLAEIKNNTAAALARTDIVTQRLNAMDIEIAAIHHHMMAERSSPPAAPVAEAAPATATSPVTFGEVIVKSGPLVRDITPSPVPPPSMKDAVSAAVKDSTVKAANVVPSVPATTGAVSTIQTPVLAAPTKDGAVSAVKDAVSAVKDAATSAVPVVATPAVNAPAVAVPTVGPAKP